MRSPDELLKHLASDDARHERLTHVERIPERPGRLSSWPEWLHPALREAWEAQGIGAPWSHQAELAELGHSRRSAVISTGTASGKSLAYLMPSLHALVESADDHAGGSASVLYISPTKALANDQLRRLST